MSYPSTFRLFGRIMISYDGCSFWIPYPPTLKQRYCFFVDTDSGGVQPVATNRTKLFHNHADSTGCRKRISEGAMQRHPSPRRYHHADHGDSPHCPRTAQRRCARVPLLHCETCRYAYGILHFRKDAQVIAAKNCHRIPEHFGFKILSSLKLCLN